MRVRHLVIGFAAVALVACGGGPPASTATSAKASPSPGGRGANAARNGASGKIVQVSGTQLVLNGQNGNVTVSYDASTQVVQTNSGSIKDAVAGLCVNVTGQKDASGAIQATLVQLMFNMNGNCTPPANANGGQGRGPGAGAGQGQGGPPNQAFDRGKITAVQGTFLTVQSNSGAVLTVDVPDTARVTRIVTVPATILALGQCVAANGQRDASGNVTARTLSLSPPDANGSCPTGIFGAFGGGQGRPSPRPSA